MALETKLEFVSIDKTGAIIKLKDSTGAYSINNSTGYNFPNTSIGDISKVILTISEFDSNKVYKQTFSRVSDIAHPEYILTPTINQLTAGTEFEVSARSLGLSTIYTPFEDGVLNINMYSLTTNIKTGIIAAIGTPFILGSNLDSYLQYDSILIGDTIYDIDKTKTTNGGTILHLVQEILVTANSFTALYRANTKIIIDMGTKTYLYNLVGKLAHNSCDCNSKTKDLLLDIEIFKWASQYAYNSGDYIEANKLIKSAYKAAKYVNCI